MPDDTSRNKTKLNARVTPSKKQEWQDALEPGETLSSLIQRAVDREIRDEYVHVKAIDEIGDSGGSDIDTTGIEERIGELQATVSALNSKVDTIAAAGDKGGDGGEEAIEDLAMDILPRLAQYPQDAPRAAGGTLPGGESPTETIQTLIDAGPQTDANIDGSAERFATELREPDHKIRRALIHLERDTTENVQSAVVNGVRHWVKFR